MAIRTFREIGSNSTLTPFEREEGRGPVFTSEEVDAIERPTGQTEGCPPNPGTVECGRADNQKGWVSE